VLRGRYQFGVDELAEIRAYLVELRRQGTNGNAPSVRATLRQRGFYLSDWARPGQKLGPDELDWLVENNLIQLSPGLGTHMAWDAFESFDMWWDYVGRCRAMSARTELDLRMIDRALMVAGQRP
jgi:hypothetical protein